ncbi:MAG: hypothetical protein K2U26_11145 [Cyclobacteriaceae bacterium]|nr:hypothetical protein [Cyclobacteriaceae bacterium]
MKKDWKYILYLSLAFGLFIIIQMLGPKQYSWLPTYAVKDKNPFGGFVLKELLPQIFTEKKISVTNQTLYELKDTIPPKENIIILAHSLNLEKEDSEALLTYVADGGHAFMSAQSFYGKLADTLHLTTYDYLFKNGLYEQRKDTSYLNFVNPQLDTSEHFIFRRENIHNYFGRFDSTRTTVIARNDYKQPVTLRITWGKGEFIFNCTPLAFTNIYTLLRNNHDFVSTTLSHLPLQNIHWLQYYNVGRLEAATPLRFILSREPLAWAYYITVGSLLLFMIFEAKRKQRIIPIIRPLENTSLEFVGTIGNLYYQRSDHKNIAEKKILFFFDQVRTSYSLLPQTENLLLLLAKKSGKPLEDVKQLLHLIESIRKKERIEKEELIELNKQIEKFWTRN